jgi:plastocyanin
MPTRRLLVLAATALVAFAVPATAHAADLVATVGPGFTIDLRDAQGQRVTALDPGAHRITVEDRSEFHNFHLAGPGVDRATDVEFIGTVVWEVTLTDGIYVFVCDPHQDSMRGSFNVGNVPLPPPPPPPAQPRQLVATVGPGAAISLTQNGRRVRTLAAGAYVITVRDRSRIHNFHLTGPGVNRRTAVARTGTFRWTVTLRAGTYRYVCDPHRLRMRGSVRVT